MPARPRLLLLSPAYPPPPGGIQAVSEQLASGMAGFEIRVLTLRSAPGPEQPVPRPAAVPVRRVGAQSLPHRARVALLGGAAVAQALRWRPQLTLSMHAVTAPAAAAIRRSTGARWAQYFHAEEIGARPRLARFAADGADLSIAVSAYTAGLVRATGAQARLTVIPNGVTLPADPSPLPCDRPTFVTVARIQERYKGHDVLVRALALLRAKLPTAQWVVIGDGSLRAGIEAMASAYGVADSCRFLGTVSDAERDAWLRRARLLAMPSRLPARGRAGEGFGIAYLEAAAYGKPVVAGNVGGALDAVVDGETGLLVDPGEPVAVAEAIGALLLDDGLAARLGAAGRERAERHSWPEICRRVEDSMRELLGSGGRGTV
jgi:phosphatidyl-myo-inositol dimannoside synthase